VVLFNAVSNDAVCCTTLYNWTTNVFISTLTSDPAAPTLVNSDRQLTQHCHHDNGGSHATSANTSGEQRVS